MKNFSIFLLCLVSVFIFGFFLSREYDKGTFTGFAYDRHENFVNVSPINQHIFDLFGEGDNGLQIRNYIITGNFTDKMGNACTQSEFEAETGLNLEEVKPIILIDLNNKP